MQISIIILQITLLSYLSLLGEALPKPVAAGVKCPRKDGYIPSPQSRSEYYLCFEGIPSLRTCEPGLHFNPRDKVCDWPHIAQCQLD
jgi:hypothetical protein